MKKVLASIILSVLFVLTTLAQEKTMSAFYYGYDSETTSYSFEDAYGEFVDFVAVDASVLRSFDLKGDEYTDVAFKITYTVDKKTGGKTIIKLEKTTLKREDDDYDDEE